MCCNDTAFNLIIAYYKQYFFLRQIFYTFDYLSIYISLQKKNKKIGVGIIIGLTEH